MENAAGGFLASHALAIIKKHCDYDEEAADMSYEYTSEIDVLSLDFYLPPNTKITEVVDQLLNVFGEAGAEYLANNKHRFTVKGGYHIFKSVLNINQQATRNIKKWLIIIAVCVTIASWLLYNSFEGALELQNQWQHTNKMKLTTTPSFIFLIVAVLLKWLYRPITWILNGLLRSG